MIPEHQYNKKARPEDQKISRTLAGILRHKAVQVGLQIDAAGFIKVTDVIAYLKKKGFPNVDEAVLQRVVDTNDKKRFELQTKGKHLCIRATQGHSIKQVQSAQLLKKITDPTLYPVVIHGTFFKFWNLIKEEGLKRMSRNHIHFAPGMPKEDGVISGMRRTCDVYITVDMFAAIKDGIDFYISSNNVILTEGVDGVLPPKYFKSVVSSKGQDLLKREEMKKQQKEEEQRQNGHKKQKNNGKKKQKTNQKKQAPKEQDEQN